jgi:hypothetical protein
VVPTQANPSPSDECFWKLSACEGPSRQRQRLVRDGCGTRHLSAARPTCAADTTDTAPAAGPTEAADTRDGDGDAIGTGRFSTAAVPETPPAEEATVFRLAASLTVFRSGVVRVDLRVVKNKREERAQVRVHRVEL